ncbi:MAG TPA: SPOR domain-containing protein [Flavobacteriales bacterium]|jgi:hypothetical protein|nr:SPOR domain-containing protein [Flavobacteriales bacterium]HIL66942.1 SPOR domain-containing protein [Flavobacteriales bacterium]
MEHYDNEQRLRILQERLGQIKNKQEVRQEQPPRVENTPTYPTYNPKATQSSDEDVIPAEEEKEKKSSGFPSKTFIRLLIFGFLVGGGYYLYTNFDFNSLLPEKSKISEQILPEDVVVPLQYSLDFGAAKYIVILSSFEEESLAKTLVEEKITEGYTANYFFLPSVSNSNEQVYRVYLGPYFSESQAKQWASRLEDESEVLNL